MKSTWIWVGSLLIAGCAAGADLLEPVQVTGRITLNGAPLANATVAFVGLSEGLPADQRYASGQTDSDGRYTIEKVVPAEYMVRVIKEVPPDPSGMVAANPGLPELAKYSADSPLRADVDQGTEFNFEL